MSFEKIIKNIRDLKIQGAEAVAVEASCSLRYIIKKSKAHTPNELLSEMNLAKARLVKTRPTEPAMRNALNFITNNIKESHNIYELSEQIKKNIDKVSEQFKIGKKLISEYGARKIKKSYVVFTHCHSSTVVDILLKAKKSKISFEVHNTETRPLFQGRKTAMELSAAGIDVKHYIDSAAMIALKKADIVFLGADAIQSDGRIINKIGSELFVEIANKHDIPVFCCTNSWKYDPVSVFGYDEEIEARAGKEIWANAPKNIDIVNPAFEVINPRKIAGIISELGIYRPATFVEMVQEKYPWLR